MSGADGNDGRSPATAWRSIDRVNAAMAALRPGDGVFFRRGHAFFGKLTVTASGIAARPILVGAYGTTGLRPEISGFKTLAGWVAVGGGVWEAGCAECGGTLNLVTIDGATQGMGRFPNAGASNGGFLRVATHTGNSEITSPELAAASALDWTGAEIVIRKSAWVFDRERVTAQSGGRVSYRTTGYLQPIDGYGFFIQDDPRTLDRLGEWFWNAATKKLQVYFGAAGPGAKVVKVSAIDTLVQVFGQHDVAFDGVAITGANVIGFAFENASRLTLRDTEVSYSGANGIDGHNSTAIVIDGSIVRNVNNDGLYLAPEVSDSALRNTLVRDNGLVPGLGKSSDQAHEGMVIHGHNDVVELNRFYNSGYIAITFRGNDIAIRNNLVDGFDLIAADGGGIYTWGYAGELTSGLSIVGNVVRNGVGAWQGSYFSSNFAAYGINTDDNSNGVTIAGNTVVGMSQSGIQLHNSYNCVVRDNTVVDVASPGYPASQPAQALEFTHDLNGPDSPIRNIAVTGNVVVGDGAGQTTIWLRSLSNDLFAFGSIDANRYVLYGSGAAFARADHGNPLPTTTRAFDFSGWRAASGYDANSTWRGVSARSALRVESNASAADRVIVLDGDYDDAQGRSHAAGPLTLAPFTSLVLMRR